MSLFGGGGNDGLELVEVDAVVAVGVDFLHHVRQLFVCQLLPEAFHHELKVFDRDFSVAVDIEDLKALADLLFFVNVLHVARHEVQELLKVDLLVAVVVHLVNHIDQLALGRLLPQRLHHRAQLRKRDCAISISVEERKGFFEFSDLLFRPVLYHFKLF